MPLDKNYTATANADTGSNDLGEYIQARLDQWNSSIDQAAADMDNALNRRDYWREQKRLYQAGELEVGGDD